MFYTKNYGMSLITSTHGSKKIICQIIVFLIVQRTVISQEFQVISFTKEKDQELGYALTGSAFRSLTTTSYAVCWFECEQDHRCSSLNYDMTTRKCDLNNITKMSKPGNFKRKENNIYVQKHREPKWMKANSSPVCFGSKNDSFGNFTIMAMNARVSDVKLVYLSGGVQCGPGTPTKWGCGEKLLTILTDNNNVRLAPLDQYIVTWEYLLYQVPLYNSNSPVIELKLVRTVKLASGKQFRLWFGEDLKDSFFEIDNGDGKTCTDVYFYGFYEE